MASTSSFSSASAKENAGTIRLHIYTPDNLVPYQCVERLARDAFPAADWSVKHIAPAVQEIKGLVARMASAKKGVECSQNEEERSKSRLERECGLHSLAKLDIDNEFQTDVVVLLVHKNESRLSIAEKSAGIGYGILYSELQNVSGDRVLVIVGRDDTYIEDSNALLSEFVLKKVQAQFPTSYMDGRKSFVLSWNNEPSQVHVSAFRHFILNRVVEKEENVFTYKRPMEAKKVVAVDSQQPGQCYPPSMNIRSSQAKSDGVEISRQHESQVREVHVQSAQQSEKKQIVGLDSNLSTLPCRGVSVAATSVSQDAMFMSEPKFSIQGQLSSTVPVERRLKLVSGSGDNCISICYQVQRRALDGHYSVNMLESDKRLLEQLSELQQSSMIDVIHGVIDDIRNGIKEEGTFRTSLTVSPIDEGTFTLNTESLDPPKARNLITRFVSFLVRTFT